MLDINYNIQSDYFPCYLHWDVVTAKGPLSCPQGVKYRPTLGYSPQVGGNKEEEEGAAT